MRPMGKNIRAISAAARTGAVLCGLVAGCWSSLAGDSCAVCGTGLTGEVFVLDDRVTSAKQQVCKPCMLSYPGCFLCGLPVRTNSAEGVQLADGRWFCPRDSKTAVLDDAEGVRLCRETRDNMERCFSRFLTLPEKNLRIEIVDRVHLQTVFKVPGQDYRCPNVWGFMISKTNGMGLEHQIKLLSGLPIAWFQGTCAHELGHAWLNENLPTARYATLSEDAGEGFCELLAYLFMDCQHDEASKARILRNGYTRGQIQAFIEAEKRFGFNDLVDWIKYGVDGRVLPSDLDRVRVLQARKSNPVAPVQSASSLPAAPQTAAPAPTTLTLKSIIWQQPRPLALINNRTFAPGEQGRVRLGGTNLLVRCQQISRNSVRLLLVESGQEKTLSVFGP